MIGKVFGGMRYCSLAFVTWRREMGYEVVVNFDACESNAICMGIVPEVFEVRDDDLLYILDGRPGDGLRSAVEQAVQLCPKQAISIEENLS